MKQALRAVPYMAISSESLLSAVMDMEGTEASPEGCSLYGYQQ